MNAVMPDVLRKRWQQFLDTPYAPEGAMLGLLLVSLFLLPRGLSSTTMVVGTISAATLALHAVGIILVYRSNRFINISQIQVASTAATLFDSLVRGRVVLRSINAVCPSCVDRTDPAYGWELANYILAVVVTLIAAAVVYGLLYNLVIRRFAKSSSLIQVLVTVFLAQALIGAGQQLRGGLVPLDQIEAGEISGQFFSPLTAQFMVGGFPVGIGDIVLVMAAFAAVAGLILYFKKTDAGTAIRAAAENPGRARTLGIDTFAVTTRVWVLAGLVGGLIGVASTLTSGAGFSADGDSVVVVPVDTLATVLAIVVVARFTNLWMAAIGAMVFGLLESAVQLSYSSQAPLNAALVFIVSALLITQQEKGGRAEGEDFSGAEVTRELRGIPSQLAILDVVRSYKRWAMLLLGGLLVGLPFAVSRGQTSLLASFLIFTLVGLSLLVVTGWAGQVSLGQFGFAAIGAWAAAASGVPFILGIPVAALAGAIAAVLVGIPGLKLKGLSLAIATLAFAVSAHAIFIDRRYLGSMLPDSLEPPSVLGLDLSDVRVYYFFIIGVVALASFAVMGLRNSRTGRVLIALRANEATAQSFGIDPFRARLTAFALAGAMTAVAGMLLSYQLGAVVPQSFAPEKSLEYFVFAVLGGLGGIAGPLIGFTYGWILTFLSGNPLLQYLGSGVGALFLIAVAPGGLAQLAYAGRDAMLRRLAYRHRIPVPSLLGEGAFDREDRASLEESHLAPSSDELDLRYRLPGQWALDRLSDGDGDTNKERVGV